ncbi:omega-6 fatty acid desaturase [Komagataella phaffii CBS 7435]|uniref:Fatty acid desaturase domain-containing protein n=3 Tax=Komagataella TaxID=460517 RepID=C4R6Q5_KOMPG|nr:Hypothetical protein PAS_chr4_0052 [Komagataella phaffii GS115]AAX20125.1 delta 12-fatty acid desaturase [Komagataella pastoris]AOA64742.1 GQ67_04361T0 [Komagataella phaffii]KAI0461574.1 hypothetical protein LJB42_000873 [Komagataella kurtzmanii]CAH2451378.1 omega-6 fatty acid desaturase [Komagataella phaffii CBS 7435]AOA69550.1 GQ68_04333T0 [Komagataella phaffii GS115]
MSAVTVTGNNGDASRSNTTTTTKRTGNVSSFSQSKGLTAIDTWGNVFKVPDFTIKQILDAIPKHCYERRLTTSFYYVFRDIFLIGCTMFMGSFIPMIENVFLRGAAYAALVFLLSVEYTGLWVLAHECGHQAFSDYGWVNDTVGWILHSYLLVPYFSWKYSHGKHHKATGHLTRDMVFVPATKEKFLEKRNASKLGELGEDAPIFTLYQLVAQQLGGWILYLFTNVTGQPYPNTPKWMQNHFVPSSPIFEKKDYWFIILSDLGILAQLMVLYVWRQQMGNWNLFIYWFLPYVLTNHWLVFITFLQHSDPTMPHYEAEQWTFARGAAATIDREFGFIGPFFFHDIIETHVLHHYVSRIPFYNAREASEGIKKVMGEHYRYSGENMWVSLWKSGRSCQFVDGENGVKMYRNINNWGIGTGEK